MSARTMARHGRGAGDDTGLLVGAWVVAGRTIRKYLRTPQVVVLALVQSVAFLLIFRYVFGGAIGTGSMRYVDFMVPGLLTAGVLFSGIRAATGVAEDLQGGFFDRLRSLPMPRLSVVAGRVLADTLLSGCVLALTIPVAFAVGFRVHASSWTEALAAFGFIVLFGFAFVWVFVALGLLAGNTQAAAALGFLALPLSFVSSAYVPVGTMPAWLRSFAEHQPVTIMIDAVRTLTQGTEAEALLGHSAGYYVVRALLWTLLICAVFAPIAVARFGRR